AISPTSWPISVVLPAPLGPITACSSPRSISSRIASEAMTPPKRLGSPSIRSSASGARAPVEEAVHAAAREQHDQEKQRAEHDLPIFAGAHRQILPNERKRSQANENGRRR